MNKIISPIIGILIFGIVLTVGVHVGKTLSINLKNEQTNKILEVMKIEKTDNKKRYLVNDKISVNKLCSKDTGICRGSFGYIKLDGIEYELSLNINFDNPDNNKINFLKLNTSKIGDFHSLKSLDIYDEKYLIITEVNKNNKLYNIYIYNSNLKQIKEYRSYDDNIYNIENKLLTYKTCDKNEFFEVKVDISNDFKETITNLEKAC